MHGNSMQQPTFGDIVSSEMDESEPMQTKVVDERSKPRAESAADAASPTTNVHTGLRATGVNTAVAYRVTGDNNSVPVLVIPNSGKPGPQADSDWRLGAQVCVPGHQADAAPLFFLD